MPNHNTANKSDANEDLMSLYESAFQQIQANSEDRPIESRRQFVRLGLLLVELMRSDLETMISSESKD